MYDKIVNPITGRKVLINGKIGKQVLENYLNQLGGKVLGSGTYKCVFSPPIKCDGESKRYGEKDGDSSNNYVSAVMSVEDSKTEINELGKILPVIDPEGEYTLNILKKCSLGDLDKTEEPKSDFYKCSSMEPYAGEYPYTSRKRDGEPHQRDLVQLILAKGGLDLDALYTDILDSGLNGIDVKDLLIGFLTILKGIKKMKDAGYVHSDIKPPIILYNKDSKRYFLIDFGLTTTIKKLRTEEIYFEYTIGAQDRVGYRYWPQDSGWANYIHTTLNVKKLKSDLLRAINTYFKTNDIVDLQLFMKDSADKFDVYSLGFIFTEFLNSNIINLLNHPKTTRLYDEINVLRTRMLTKNPIIRPSIEEVIESYTTIMTKYFPSDMAVAAVAPVPKESPAPLAPPTKPKNKKIVKKYKKTKAVEVPKTTSVKCSGRKKGPKGKTCKVNNGTGCCLDKGIKKHCKWVSGSKGKPGKCVNK